MANSVNVSSTSVPCKTQEGHVARKKIATLRLAGPSELDIFKVADGTKSVLTLIKEVATEVSQVGAPGDPVASNWTGLVAVPPTGMRVKISVGFLVEYVEEV